MTSRLVPWYRYYPQLWRYYAGVVLWSYLYGYRFGSKRRGIAGGLLGIVSYLRTCWMMRHW